MPFERFYRVGPGEYILYFDINVSNLFDWLFIYLLTMFQSLYPSVNFSTEGELWPIGHPVIYLHSFPPVHEIFGLIKGTFKPTNQLFHPVLGVKTNDKLMFGLCQTCMENQSTEYCTHRDSERQLEQYINACEYILWVSRYITGTFVSEEVKLALEKGYEVVSIDEVWHWPTNQRSETLFHEFIATAYREKLEASGNLFKFYASQPLVKLATYVAIK